VFPFEKKKKEKKKPKKKKGTKKGRGEGGPLLNTIKLLFHIIKSSPGGKVEPRSRGLKHIFNAHIMREGERRDKKMEKPRTQTRNPIVKPIRFWKEN